MSITFASILSILSAITVAVLSHFFSLKRKRQDDLAEMKIRAYTDFINATSRLVTARRLGITEDELTDLVALNDAKNRILICGDAEVVESLMIFWNAGGTLENESEILAFKQFCLDIRESLGNKHNDIASLNLSDAIFKIEPSGYSFRASGE